MSDFEPDDATIAELTKRAEQATQLERVNALQKAELAVLKAGVPTGTKIGQAFLAELVTRDDVDYADPEAVHQAAQQWGLWQPEGDDAKEVPEGQQAAVQMRTAMQGGSSPDPTAAPPSDPTKEGWDRFKDRVFVQGHRREDAAAEVIDRLITGAVRGDERAMVKKVPTPFGTAERVSNDIDIPFVAGRQQ